MPLHVLVAPASLKECLSAAEAARAMAAGARRAGAEATELPLADGGRGTTECIVQALGGRIVPVPVTGPLGEPMTAALGLIEGGETAVFEMASASGLALVPPGRRDAMRATTHGTGDLLRAALDAGARRLFMGIGDSATSDGGAGLAQALGFHLLDGRGEEIGPGAEGLAGLARIDDSEADARLAKTRLSVACDVDNLLLGPRGAARVFSPQKGAAPQEVERIEAALARFADLLERTAGIDVRSLPGGGAAGGLGAGAVALLGAHLVPGAEWILDCVNLEAHLARADLVLTAEGRFDAQSLRGKAPMALARRAGALGVPCIVIPGSLGPGYEPALEQGVTGIFPLVREDVTLAEAMARADELLGARAEEAVRRSAATPKGDAQAR
ncbi:MAG: glycerate kinase [Planctomycetes bacterium]|nr:glycerate kinase [Planctomycetota bacterium]